MKNKCIETVTCSKSEAIEPVSSLEAIFPIGLVKTEFGFIVRSVETGLGR